MADLLKLVMHSLVKSGLLLEIETRKEHKAWALNPEHLFITADLGAVRLRRGALSSDQTDSGSSTEESEELQDADFRSAYGSWYLPNEWIDYIAGMPSLDQAFGGKSSKHQAIAMYEANEHPRQSMYRDFYIHGQIKLSLIHI